MQTGVYSFSVYTLNEANERLILVFIPLNIKYGKKGEMQVSERELWMKQ
jgi:hypothetical protein